MSLALAFAVTMIALLGLSAAGGAAAPQGLVAAYAFDEGTGTSVADASGNANAGTVANATWTTSGKFGKALSFNGTSARVNVPNAATLQLSSGMTVEAWVNPTTVSNAWRDVIYKGDDNYYIEATSQGGSRPVGGGIIGGTTAEARASTALTANTWAHLAVTYDGAAVRLYVNGVQAASTARTGAIRTSTNPLQIGSDSIYGQYFRGTIDEVRVYNLALTAAEVQTDMNTPIGGGTSDTTPPTAPGTLSATATSSSQINLSWGAATDNVGVTGYRIERCQGAGCTNFTQIAAPPGTGTTYTDTALTPSTSYSYQVRAVDAIPNLGPYTNTATATTPAAADTTPPTAPGTLSATATSSSQINLSWGAATDNVGVTGYRIERCQGAGCTNFTQIAAPPGTGTTYTDTALTPSTSYSYQVRAVDAIPNLGPYTNTATATTPAAADTTPPTAPGTLSATATSSSQINLSWGAATDNVGVTGYRIERCQGAGCTNFTQIAAPPGTGTTYTDTALTPSTSYSYQVRAVDAIPNLGPYTNTATATTLSNDDTPVPPVAAYSFDEGAGSTVADASGNGNGGAVANTTWTTNGKFGKALVFNGTSSRVNVPDAASLHLSTGMTLEAWVNPASVASAWRDVIYKGNDNYYLEGSSDHGGVPAAGGTFGGGGTTAFGSSTLATNSWSYLATTYDGATLRLYLNGILVGSTAKTGNIASSTNQLQIGGDGLFGQYFNGLIDEVPRVQRATAGHSHSGRHGHTDQWRRINRHPTPNATRHSERVGGELQRDRPELGGRYGQRRSYGLPDPPLPGSALRQLRGARTTSWDWDDLQGHRPDRQHELQLRGARGRRGREPRASVEHRNDINLELGYDTPICAGDPHRDRHELDQDQPFLGPRDRQRCSGRISNRPLPGRRLYGFLTSRPAHGHRNDLRRYTRVGEHDIHLPSESPRRRRQSGNGLEPCNGDHRRAGFGGGLLLR